MIRGNRIKSDFPLRTETRTQQTICN